MLIPATPVDQDLRFPTQRVVDGRRPIWFLFSAVIHGCLLCLVAFGPRPAPRTRRPIFESIIRPNQNKIIWYRKLPEIAPRVKIGTEKDPRGEVKSATTLIATSPRPKSSKQLVLHPTSQIQLDEDLRAANSIALAAPLPLPAQPKRAKPFVPPVPINKPKAPAPVLTELDVKLSWSELGGKERTLELTRPKRAFMPPPRETPKLPVAQPVLENAPEVGLGSVAKGPELSRIAVPGRPAPKPFTPPSGRSSGGAAGSAGSTASAGSGISLESAPDLPAGASVSSAIVGLNPTDKLGYAVPPGSRPAQFSAAPRVGETASGDVGGPGSIAVPGLVVRDGKGERVNSAGIVPAPGRGSRVVRYDDLVPPSVHPALSAPLRPASRTVPRALEGRFQGRLIYAIVIPAPNLPEYAGDWIVWFAEQSPKPGAIRIMRAPAPLRKTEFTGHAQIASRDGSEARIQLAAVIKSDGRLESITPLKGPNSSRFQSAIDDLSLWEFRPAMLDDAPIGVEVVFEIPFNLAWLNSSP